MKTIKAKIIRLLGGYTLEEINVFRRRKAELEAVVAKQKEQMVAQLFDALDAKQANKAYKTEFANLRELCDKLEVENIHLIQQLNALESGNQPSEAANEKELAAIATVISYDKEISLTEHTHDSSNNQETTGGDES